MSFPRINALSFWMLVAGAVLIVSAFAFGGAPTGWTLYVTAALVTSLAVTAGSSTAFFAQWITDEGVNAVITTGGTGITGRDTTPEAVAALFDKQIDGFGELFRAVSYEEINTSTMQSRAVGGVANATFVFCLPGSTGACRTGWDDIIGPQLDYRNRPCNMVELMPRLLEK